MCLPLPLVSCVKSQSQSRGSCGSQKGKQKQNAPTKKHQQRIRLGEHGLPVEVFDLVHHDLEVHGLEGLDLRHGVLGAVVERVVEDARGGH